MSSDILNVVAFVRSKCQIKKKLTNTCKSSSHNYKKKDAKKSENRAKIMKFPVCTYQSEIFAQSQLNFGQTHVRVSVTFRNSACQGLEVIWVFIRIFQTIEEEKIYITLNKNSCFCTI